MITPYSIASKFIGQKEIVGIMDNPIINIMLQLDAPHGYVVHDEIAWCSAFINLVAYLSGMRRTRSWMARSWLGVGDHIQIDQARQGSDIVILKRSAGIQPGPENMMAPGHVGFYAFHHKNSVWILGGNQNDMVCISEYPTSRVLGIRRLE